MIYFIPGASNKCKFPDNFGAIVTPSNRDLAVQLKRIQSGWRWICDNGAFTGQFNADKFYRFLEKMKPYQTQCQFVIVPDVVGDARATLERFEEHAARIRELDYRVAFAAQDGQEFLEFPHEFDTLFIGGSTDWKLSEKATICIKRAQTLGKWVHIGRAS